MACGTFDVGAGAASNIHVVRVGLGADRYTAPISTRDLEVLDRSMDELKSKCKDPLRSIWPLQHPTSGNKDDVSHIQHGSRPLDTESAGRSHSRVSGMNAHPPQQSTIDVREINISGFFQPAGLWLASLGIPASSGVPVV